MMCGWGLFDRNLDRAVDIVSANGAAPFVHRVCPAHFFMRGDCSAPAVATLFISTLLISKYSLGDSKQNMRSLSLCGPGLDYYIEISNCVYAQRNWEHAIADRCKERKLGRPVHQVSTPSKSLRLARV